MDEKRLAALCNGRRLPLRPTRAAGEFVAGVRFRARLFPDVQHPTIGVHTPLVFDVIDLRTRRSLGGCAYYATNPEGRDYDRPPENEFEAESRRKARFVPRGAAASAAHMTPEPMEADTPCTLDLRYLAKRSS
jgi:uncharacterized protein (DUF2126 family)